MSAAAHLRGRHQRKRFSLGGGQGSKDKQPCKASASATGEESLKGRRLTARRLFSRPSLQVWTFGDTSLSSGSSGRHSVQTVTSDHGVLSSLVLSETQAQDFQLRYNCTAWNRFGTGTALVTLKEQGTRRGKTIPTRNPSVSLSPGCEGHQIR